MPRFSRGIPRVLLMLLIFSPVLFAPLSDALSSEDAPIFISRGYELYNQARYTESRDAFLQAIALDPYSEPSWYGLGIAHFAAGNNEESIRALERAISLSPKDERAWMKEGEVFSAMGRKDLALNAYQRTVLLNPNNFEAMKNIEAIGASLAAASPSPTLTGAITPTNTDIEDNSPEHSATVTSPAAVSAFRTSVTLTETTAPNLTIATSKIPSTPRQSDSPASDTPNGLVAAIIILAFVAIVLLVLWIRRDKVKGLIPALSGTGKDLGESRGSRPREAPAGPTEKPRSGRTAATISELPGVESSGIRGSGGNQPWTIPSKKVLGILGLVVLAGIVIALLVFAINPPSTDNPGEKEPIQEPALYVPSTPAPQLREYRDDTNYFSISLPDEWTVAVTDAIVASDSADGGTTRVRIQPVHLSGSYRSMTATAVANYIVGKEKVGLSQFSVNRVRASGDGQVLEIGVSFSRNGVRMNRVYMIFVNTPYALVSSYETTESLFNGKEELLRSIMRSYSQSAPPAPVSQASTQSSLGALHGTALSGGIRILLPDGWLPTVLPGCSGLVAAEQPSGLRGIAFVNSIHQSAEPLPPGVTPEDYITTYMPLDFSQSGTTISDVRILSYEEGDVSALTNNGGVNVKAMRVSFTSNGAPCIGSFTVGTYQTGISTAVAYFWGIWSTTDMFAADAPELLQIFSSIDYSSSTVAACRDNLNTAWAGARKTGDTLARNADQMREENLALYQDRQSRNDEFLEKFSDAILDRDRVYNPGTDQVYEVDPDFYTYYDTHREEYRYQDMRELETGEWLKYTTLDGTLHIQ
ncbi:MAG: tetratricopeptide repeat protein [Methanoregulaceae archaeon]|nr:tetratricopeptide repeat protein [Methanoregulaceae archaeon]